MNITEESITKLKDRFLELSEPLECLPTGVEPKLKKLTGIEAVIFDFYGTLFISGVGDIGIDDGASDEKLLIEALESSEIAVSSKAAGARGYQIYTKAVKDQMLKLKGSGIIYPEPDIRKVWRDVLSQMHAEDLISTKTDSSHYNRMAVEFEARMNPVWPMSDMKTTLHELHQKNVALGIISNSQFYTPYVLEALSGKSLPELGFNPDLLHWSFEESVKKPSLVFYERFLEKAKEIKPELKPENYLYIGNDMLKDVYPAHECGMKTALFAGDKRSLKWRKKDDRCRDLKPDIVVTELSQVLECL